MTVDVVCCLMLIVVVVGVGCCVGDVVTVCRWLSCVVMCCVVVR